MIKTDEQINCKIFHLTPKTNIAHLTGPQTAQNVGYYALKCGNDLKKSFCLTLKKIYVFTGGANPVNTYKKNF